MKWQRTTRWAIALAAVAFAVAAASTMRKRNTTAPPEAPVARTDEKAVLETASGFGFRVNKNREEVRIDYDRMLTYPDGSNKMLGLKVTTDREGRIFTITGAEGQVGQGDTTIDVTGNVRITANDGLSVTTEHATFTEADGFARAPGPVAFSRGRMNGTGVGFTYDKNADILTILDQSVVHVGADEAGNGAMDVASGAMEYRRNEASLRFDRTMKATKPHETIEADTAVAHLTSDEKHLEAVELRGQSRITMSGAGAGGLQALTGRDIDLKYGAGTETIEHAVINGDAVIQLAGEGRQPGRQISAASLDTVLAADGSTPTSLVARENVRLNLPAEENGINRAITSQTLDGGGDPQHGLTKAHMAGNVVFSERGPDVNRTARSAMLDVSLKGGFTEIEDAVFTRGVRFVDGTMTTTSAAARYVPGAGTLKLTGSEPGSLVPHVATDRIVVDAALVDVTLQGPMLQALGSSKSVLLPQPADGHPLKPGEPDVRLPSMLKKDQPVNVTADALDYSGDVSKAVYTGNAQLWQGETVIKAPSITIDSKTGDLSATGPVATVSILEQQDKDGAKERVRSMGSGKAFAYQDSDRRATYTGDAHLSGPQGDLTAQKIEVFLQGSGDELDRVEGYDAVTLISDTQKTTGTRLTYFAVDGRYLVNGMPVTTVDNCGRETTGRALTFFKSTDRIIVDGREGIRTQTKGKSNCPGM